MAKATPGATATSKDTTYTLNGSNHPDIGPDGLAVGEVPVAIPNPTPSLLDYLRQLPGVVVTLPDAPK
jgi:hypothetical protein